MSAQLLLREVEGHDRRLESNSVRRLELVEMGW